MTQGKLRKVLNLNNLMARENTIQFCGLESNLN